MKKIKYALMLCLAAFALVVTGCGNPEDGTANTEQSGNGSVNGSGNSDASSNPSSGDGGTSSGALIKPPVVDDGTSDAEANMPDLFTMTAEPCDQGIRVTVSYTELAGGEFIITGNDIYESNTGLNITYPSSLNETGSCTFVFPFTESGKKYTFGIRGNYNGNAYDGYFDKKIVSCSATVTTEEGAWFEKNRDYFNNFDVDCKYNFSTKSVEATRNFPTVEGMSESESLAKIKEIKESVLSTPSSITKIEKRFSCFVYGYVDWWPGATWKGLGAQELTLDDISTTETSYLYPSYTFNLGSFIDNGYDGKYAGCYGYHIFMSNFTWRTWDRWSDQEYFYVNTGSIATSTSSEGTRVLHAVYAPVYKKYIVIAEERKTVASGTSLDDLKNEIYAISICPAVGVVQTTDYVAVLYRKSEDEFISNTENFEIKKITSEADFDKDPLYLRYKIMWDSSGSANYVYYYLENGKLYGQAYKYDADSQQYTKDGAKYEDVFPLLTATMNLCKIGDLYFMYSSNAYMKRISGSGIYSTFSYTLEFDGDTSTRNYTFSEDGVLTTETSYKGETYTYTTSYEYNNDGVIVIHASTESLEHDGYFLYDGNGIYTSTVGFEEVSGLPTVTETTVSGLSTVTETTVGFEEVSDLSSSVTTTTE